MSAAPAKTPLPFTILTGFLGAGKTTVLNRILAVAADEPITVMVNELGTISLDDRLIRRRGGDVLELSGGCVCCTVDVNKDLWQGIREVIERTKPRHLVLETTGVAEPQGILQGLRELPSDLRSGIQVAGVACVLDASVGADTLERFCEARAQLAATDRAMVTKADLATRAQVGALHDAVRAARRDLELVSFVPGDDRALLAWLLEVRPQSKPVLRTGPHHHDLQLGAVSFSTDAALSRELLLRALATLGDALVRAKGFVRLAGESGRGATLDVSSGRTSLVSVASDAPSVERTEIVLIGMLDESVVRGVLGACVAAVD